MVASVKEFFDGLPGRVDSGKTAGVNTTYLFDIEGAGQWTVAVTDDGVDVHEGAGDAACTITTSEATFLKIANGDQNPTSAYMTGKLKVKGDMGAAMKLQKLF
jgi:putative sterol carrier protein